MSWHCDPSALMSYADGAASDSVAWSVETHLTACGVCRQALTHHLVPEDRDRLGAARGGLSLPPQQLPGGLLRVVRRQGWALRLGRRPWPAVRSGVLGPWWAWAGFVFLATAVLAVASLVPSWRAAAEGRVDGLVLLSPVLPVALVAVVYAVADRDPVSDSTARGGLELVLIRTAAVLALTVPLVAGVRSFHGVPAATWLLPGLGLCLLSLAVGTWVGVERAAVTVSAIWLGICVLGLAPTGVRLPLAGVLAQTGPQPLWWAVLVVSVGVLVWRRDRFGATAALWSRTAR